MTRKLLFVVVAISLVCAALLGGSQVAAQAASVRLRAGGAAYTDTLAQLWATDNSFSGGAAYSTTSAIASTPDQALYRTERYGQTFSYTLQLVNGDYLVTLKFAETYWTTSGKRKFSVSANGTPVSSLQSFDIFAAAGAANTAVDRTFPVTVTTGTLTLGFTSQLDNAKVDAIQVVPATAPTPTSTSTSTPTPASTATPTATPAVVHTCAEWLTLDGTPTLYTRPLSACTNQ